MAGGQAGLRSEVQGPMAAVEVRLAPGGSRWVQRKQLSPGGRGGGLDRPHGDGEREGATLGCTLEVELAGQGTLDLEGRRNPRWTLKCNCSPWADGGDVSCDGVWRARVQGGNSFLKYGI